MEECQTWEFRTVAACLQKAATENDAKWQTLGEYVWPNPVIFDTYSEEVAHMKAWYTQRMDWLDNALNNI